MATPNAIQITDRGDSRIAPFVGIRERDLTGGTDGRFIVEGKVPLSILLTKSRFELDSLFLCESRLQPLAEILTMVPEEIPVYTATQELMDSIAGFPIHRGVLACARKGDPTDLSVLLEAQRVLILNQLSNHDNVGAAFRNAAAFGVDGILLDERSCDPLYRKAIRVSSGASLWMPFHHGGTGDDQLEALKAAGFEIWAMTPHPGAAPIHDLKPPAKLAIVLGAEGPGLPAALIEAAQAVRIPMQKGFDSINVATAGAIALSHVFSAQ